MLLLKDVSPPPNAPMDKNQQMESAPVYAIMDSSSMRVFASMEDASLGMLITDSEDASELEHHPSLPALPDSSNLMETVYPTVETDSSQTTSARSA